MPLNYGCGDSDAISSHVGFLGEIGINTTTKTIHVFDGSTAGGTALAKSGGGEGGGEGIGLSDLSVTINSVGINSLSYNNTTGVFNFTPTSLVGYATEAYVDSAVAGVVTFSGNYNNLSNKPDIPSDTSDLTNNVGFVTSSIVVGYATEGYVDSAVAGVVTSIVAGTNITISSSTGQVTISASETSTYATSAGISTVSDYATSAGISTVSDYATTAGISTYATSAGISTYATSSGISTYATTAGISTVADYATAAGISTYATTAGISTVADYATSAGISTYATSSGISTYATTAGISTVAEGLTGTPSITVGIVTATSLIVTGQSVINRVAISTVGVNTTLETGNIYVYKSGVTELTLPASPTVGDRLRIINRSGITTTVILGNGSNIMGSASDLQFDELDAGYEFTYADTDEGWVIG